MWDYSDWRPSGYRHLQMVWQRSQNENFYYQTVVFEGESISLARQAFWLVGCSGDVGPHGCEEGWGVGCDWGEEVGGPYSAEVCSTVCSFFSQRQEQFQAAEHNEALPPIYLPFTSVDIYKSFWFPSRPSDLREDLFDEGVNSQLHGDDPARLDQIQPWNSHSSACGVGYQRIEIGRDSAAGQLL